MIKKNRYKKKVLKKKKRKNNIGQYIVIAIT